jgi:hypothetical protein
MSSIVDKQHFDKLVKGVREMKRHMSGKRVRGSRTTEILAPNPPSTREAALKKSQADRSD